MPQSHYHDARPNPDRPLSDNLGDLLHTWQLRLRSWIYRNPWLGLWLHDDLVVVSVQSMALCLIGSTWLHQSMPLLPRDIRRTWLRWYTCLHLYSHCLSRIRTWSFRCNVDYALGLLPIEHRPLMSWGLWSWFPVIQVCIGMCARDSTIGIGMYVRDGRSSGIDTIDLLWH